MKMSFRLPSYAFPTAVAGLFMCLLPACLYLMSVPAMFTAAFTAIALILLMAMNGIPIRRLSLISMACLCGFALSGCVYNTDGSPNIIASINQGTESIVTDLEALTQAANQANLSAVNEFCTLAPQLIPLWKIAVSVGKIPANIVNDGNAAAAAVIAGCNGSPFMSFTLEAAGAVNAWNAFEADMLSANVKVPANLRRKLARWYYYHHQH